MTSRGSRGWVDPVPDPLLLRKSGSAGDRTRDLCICSQKFWPPDQLDALISQIYFWNKTLHVSDSSSVNHQEFFYCTRSNSICHTGLADSLRASCQQTVWQRNCPKHVAFYSKNKFEKLMHLVGSIVRIFHDAGHLNVKFCCNVQTFDNSLHD